MGKLSLIAALVLIGLGLAASVQPAAAASMATCQSEKVLNENGVFVDKIQLYRDTIAMRLRREGYNVSSVEPWGGCVRETDAVRSSDLPDLPAPASVKPLTHDPSLPGGEGVRVQVPLTFGFLMYG